MKTVYYSQYNKRWANEPYPSPQNPTGTILTSACGPTCASMVVATLVNKLITPVDLAHLAIKLGDRVNGGTADVFFSHVAKEYKLPFTEAISLKTAITALRNGKLVVCRMQNWFGSGKGHFILARGISGDKIQINDPASRANTAKLYDQSVFLEKCIGYFIFSALIKVAPVQKQDVKPQPKPIIKKTVIPDDGVNIRKGPDAKFNKIGALEKGKVVEVLETSNGWDRIKFGDGQGWVCNKNLK